jgi:hypothetical protein
MPIKRRIVKARARYPDAIERLISGAPLEWSPEAWDELLGAFFFGDYNVPPEAKARARELLDDWREQQLGHDRMGRSAR